jgi:hypothetical protein
MPDLVRDLQHLKADVKKIHDYLEHLNEHSGVCSELVKESNVREAEELFEHLKQIDQRIHEVQEHIGHINVHLDSPTDSENAIEEVPIDTEDLKSDAKHTSLDLKDIHTSIDHLIAHASSCQDIIAPDAKEELGSISEHLEDIDEIAHELLWHIHSLRGEISTVYSEFIWPVPADVDEDYLRPTELVESDDPLVKDLALRLMDGAKDVSEAVSTVFYYTRDFIAAKTSKHESYTSSSFTMNSCSGGGISKAILVCAILRAVSIPSRIRFYGVLSKFWETNPVLEGKPPIEPVTIAVPEACLTDGWVRIDETMAAKIDVKKSQEKFVELDMPDGNVITDETQWSIIPESYLKDLGNYHAPKEFLTSSEFMAPAPDLDRRLFAGSVYNGVFVEIIIEEENKS